METTSAGFVGPGRRSPDNALARADRGGLDLSQHESTLLSAERVLGATFIVVMDSRQKRAIRRRFSLPPGRVLVLGDLDPNPIETRAIRDPWGQPDEVLAASYDRIDRCINAFAKCIPGFTRDG